jgi:hypothetical protein
MLKLDEELTAPDTEPWCGVQIINVQSADIVEWIRLEGGDPELFDTRVLPGAARHRHRHRISHDRHCNDRYR